MAPSDETPWLREMADEEVEDLFEENPQTLQRIVHRYLERLAIDDHLADDFIDTLLQSLEHHNDDTDATLWIILILGKAGIIQAIHPIIQALGDSESEEIQRVANIALLMLGEPAVNALLDFLEEEEEQPAPELSLAAYKLFGHLGYLDDPQLHQRVIEFLRVRLELDGIREQGLRLQEEAALALSLLGDLKAQEKIKELQQKLDQEHNPAFLDALEHLEENKNGAPLALDKIPGEEDYEWIFAFAPEPTRKRMEESETDQLEAQADMAESEEEFDEDDRDLFYKGMGGD